MIQFFEMCFELSWNTIKDYLEAQGFGDLKTPRGALKKAFQIGLIPNGAAWLKGLEDRNLTSHMYNEDIAKKVETMIREVYAPLFHSLENELVELSHEEN